MEELKLLIEMVKDLPSAALWCLGLFFGYKVIIVGSIYTTVKYVVKKVHDVLVDRKKVVHIEAQLDDITIAGSYEPLLTQLHRLPTTEGRSYIHKSDVIWLKQAIDEKLKSEGKEDRTIF